MTPSRDARFTDDLAAWFSSAARDLPWRRSRNGYAALVSEAMLQQTQVSRVIEKFSTFMERFPTVQSLANAEEQQVLAAWQGLGYYRRARHLHAAAKKIMTDYDGQVPRDVVQLRTLPGVGRYTAGAIASIVFSHPEPIVDGNVQRLLARLDARHSPPVEEIWIRAEQLVRVAEKPGVFNEAMMELGATICTPKSPRCDACPVAQHCSARKRKMQSEIPVPKAAPRQEHVHHHAVVVMRRNLLLVEQRPETGLWSNMWQVPTFESMTALSAQSLAEQLKFRVNDLTKRESFTHMTTHRRISFHVFAGRTRARRGHWLQIDDTGELPMSAAQRRILDLAQQWFATPV